MVKATVDALQGELLEATNGQEALTILEKNQGNIDLIILDWNMPLMNGMEFLQIVKSNDKFKHIPVIMNTTESEKHKIIAAIQAGASNYMTKPFTEQDLTKKIMDTVVSYNKLFNNLLCKELKDCLNSITGLKVVESQAESDAGEDYYAGQLLVSGDVNAFISIRLSRDHSFRLASLLLEKSQQEITPQDVPKGLLKLLKTVSDKTAVAAKSKMNIIFAYLFAGFIGENMAVFNSSKKLYKLELKFNAGLLEMHLQVQHY
jgi:two-component system chemotaxis response regulator CheY